MSDPTNLNDLYVEELQDLWSANDQMKSVVEKMVEKTSDSDLSDALGKSVKGIQTHTDLLKSLLEDCDAELTKEHCKGMEGLVKEARKHAIEPDVPDDVRAVAMLAQYQRMCHYGIAGFGTARAFADALGKDEAARKLEDALDDIYEADDFATQLAERSKNLEAK